MGVIIKNKSRLPELLSRYDENLKVDRYPVSSVEEEIKARATYGESSKTQEDILKDIKSDFGDLVENDIIYSDFNPEAKWDWWVIGGRWDGCLKTVKKDFTVCETSISKIKNINWRKLNYKTEKQIKEEERYWDVVVNKAPLAAEENKKDFYCPFSENYLINKYGTKENYIKNRSLFSTYALLIDDGEQGEWIEPGEVGWFGTDSSNRNSTEEYLKEFYDTVEDTKYRNYYFIVVDCHI